MEINAGKSVALLAYLAVSGQVQSRDTLGTLLWPDKDQAQARTYLRHPLWTVKKALGSEAIDAAGISDPALVEKLVAALNDVDQNSLSTKGLSKQAAWHQAWGMVYLFQNNQDQAVESFEKAVTLWDSIKRPFDQAKALTKLGQALAMTGQHQKSHSAYKKANKRIQALAAQLDDDETQITFLQTPLVQAITSSTNGV